MPIPDLPDDIELPSDPEKALLLVQRIEADADRLAAENEVLRLRAELLEAKAREYRDIMASLAHEQKRAARMASLRLPERLAEFRGRIDEARRAQRTPDPNLVLSIEALTQLAQQMMSRPAPAPEAAPVQPSPMFSDGIEEFMAGKKEYTAQTGHQVRASLGLWMGLIGDGPVRECTGAQAVRFQQILRRLPASHGKSRNPLPPAQAIEDADRRERDTGKPVPRLTEKTVKRHFSALSQYWLHLKRGQHVAVNIFADFEFPGTKAKKKLRDDWSPADIKKLLATPWRSRIVPEETYRWVTAISAYSGMRLEEICRLRPEDIEIQGGYPFIILQDHPDGWSPKTEAGERAVPVHRKLIAMGFTDYVEKRRADGAQRLFPDLRHGGPDGKLGFDFSREFGKHKTRAGVGGKVVFHSWRHSASTILRNKEATIRGEWIDAVLGHENGSNSQGATTYLKRIGAANLRSTMNALDYQNPDDPEADPDADPILLVVMAD